MDCEPLAGSFPWPPKNGTAMSSYHSSDADLRWDDPADLNTGPEVDDSGTVTTASVKVVTDGTPEILAPATGSFIVVSSPIPEGETIEIDGLILTCVWGVPGADEFSGSSSDPNVVATSLNKAINDGSAKTWGLVTSTVVGTSVQLTAQTSGSKGNSITLVSSSSRIVPSDTTLTGGTDQSVLTLGGIPFSGVQGARTSGSRDFDIDDAGASLAEAINDPANGLTFLTASWGGTCLVLSSTVAGETGNGIEVSSNTTTLFPTHTATYGGAGTPCPPGQNNSRWKVLGVNVYRSDTGERGPYFRVNNVPVGSLFYRDRTDVGEVPSELVPWNGGWVFKGDSPNNKGWRLKTRYSPVVKDSENQKNAVLANSPFDVEVYVDGTRVVVDAVFGLTGEIDLSTERVWDPSTETFLDPPIPTESSTVQVRYYYRKGNKLVNTLDDRYKVFYRLTTVAQDPTGTSSTGLVETPLGYSPPISPMNSEQMDYIWKEAIRRNRWILEQGGERVKLFIRRVNGVRCTCLWDSHLEVYSKQPFNQCYTCYGTGWVGGYEGPYDLIVGPDDSERRVTQTPTGRRLENTYEVWIGPTPTVSQRDFIVKQNGERFSIGPVHRTQIRGLNLHQSFQIGYLDNQDIRYSVPMGALERLPWPQTRYTSPELSPCETSEPFPVGADYQGSPMMTEKAGIPDSRQKRGRTPVYQNLTYGGKGTR